MSLSFPILLSAIRLYEADPKASSPRHQEPAERASPGIRPKGLLQSTDGLAVGGAASDPQPGKLRPCWFSDGGIGSNFPLHLFDAALPSRPTFAINLVYLPNGAGEKVTLLRDEGHWQPPFESYRKIESSLAVREVLSFLLAIINTMQNWRDLLQSRAPGHRDRIVHVPMDTREGGLNLDMDDTMLGNIIARGCEAGKKLRSDFDFNNHWWIRWRNLATTTERFVIAFGKTADAPPADSYAQAHSAAVTGSPQPAYYRLVSGTEAEAQARFALMKELGLSWDGMKPPLGCNAPEPTPDIRIVPTF
jgi:hypothetical protein